MNNPIQVQQLPDAPKSNALATFSDFGAALRVLFAWTKLFTNREQSFLNQIRQQLNSQVQGVGVAIASAATIAVSNPIHHITGAVTITTIAAPPGFSGPLWLIADGAFSTGLGGNIALASGPLVVGSVLLLTFDPAAGASGVWYPLFGSGGSSGGATMLVVTLAFASSPYTATLSTAQWTMFLCSASAGADFVFNLPAATGSGDVAIIKKMDANAHNIAVTPNGTDTFDGVNAAVNVAIQYDDLRLLDSAAGKWVTF